MALVRCPKCELNYIKGEEKFCDVCLRGIASGLRVAAEKEEEVLMCAECGEAPAACSNELCVECIKEQKRQVQLENAVELDAEYEEAIAADEIEEDEE